MNLEHLKKIVDDFATNFEYVKGSPTAEADLLVMAAMSLDRWLVSAVQSLGGDVSLVIRNNETALEMALQSHLYDAGGESEYYFDGVTEIPVR